MIENERELFEKFKRKLIEDYGYKDNDIKFESEIIDFSIDNKKSKYIPDIVVYKNGNPYIFIEIKATFFHKEFESIRGKLNTIHLKSNIPFFVIYSPEIMEVYEIIDGKKVKIENIPHDLNNIKNRIERDYDEQTLIHLFDEIRDILKGNGKRDDYTIIKEFNKILLISFSSQKQFSADSITDKSYQDLNHYFYKIKNEYGIFDSKEELNLSEVEIRSIFPILDNLDFSKTKDFIEKVYFQSFVKPLKTELMLSYELLLFLKSINNFNDHILVPNSEFGQIALSFNNVDIIENNNIKIETSKILSLLKNIELNVINEDYLEFNPYSNRKSYNIVISIPPLNRSIKSLSPYSKGINYISAFIEKSNEVLLEYGYLYLIVPNSVLANYTYEYTREYIKRYFVIEKVISIPSEFILNSDISLSLIILRKDEYLNKNYKIDFFELDISNIQSPRNKNSINFNDLENRLDFHFYRNEFLYLEDEIKKYNFEALDNFVETYRGSSLGGSKLGGIEKLITVGSIENGQINKNKLSQITKEQNYKNKRGIVRENDLLITVVGQYPKCAKVTQEFIGANTNSGIVILRLKENSPLSVDYLHSYLNSLIGGILLHRYISYSSTVPILTQGEIKKIPVISSKEDFDELINRLLSDNNISNFLDKNLQLTTTIESKSCDEKLQDLEDYYKNKINNTILEKDNEYFERFNLIDESEAKLSIYGIHGEIFGLRVIRSYISLNKLSDFETNKQDFQRDLDSKHKNELVEYIKKPKYNFLPEIVLAVRNTDTHEDNERIRIKDINGDTNFVVFSILDKSVYDDIEVVDGRHRIESIKQYLDEDRSKENITISIAFILLDETFTKNLVDRGIFYHLNAKAKPFLSKDYLHLLESDDLEVLKDLDIIEIEYYKHLTMKKKDFYPKSDDLDILVGCIDIVKKINEYYKGLNQKKLFKLIDLYSSLYKVLLKDLKIEVLTKFYLLILDLLFTKKIKPKKRFEYFNKNLDGFIEWLNLSNLFDSLNTIDNLKSFYKTYEKTYVPKSRKIYISMPYHKETEWTYFVIKDVINEISKNLNLEIKDIRTDKESNGVHTGISEKVYEEIANCDLMIADLTGGNANVFNEVGFKMGLDKAEGLKETQIIFIVNSKCYYEEFLEYDKFMDNGYKVNGKLMKNKSKAVPFNLRGIKHIEFYESHYLKAELYKELEKYFSYYRITKISK